MVNKIVTVTGLQEALDSLTVFQRVHIPGSVVWTLNKFVVELREHEKQRIQYTFNKTNAFTRNSPLFKLATKESPRTTFFLRDNAPGGNSPDRYLSPQVTSGPIYVTRFSRALRRSQVIGSDQYVMHWANPRYKPTPGFVSSLKSALTRSVGPVRGGRQYARNVKAVSQYFIRYKGDEQGNLFNEPTGPATAIFKRVGRNKLDLVYSILKKPPTVAKKYDWTLQRMSLMAEDRIPVLLFGKLAEF